MEGFIAPFAAELRARAALLRDHGATEAAVACEKIASELEQAFREWWLAELTVSEASVESGYSTDRLRELVREGRLPDRRLVGSGGGGRGGRAGRPPPPPTPPPPPPPRAAP